MADRTISIEEAAGKTVGEVMIRSPKTLPGDVSVGDVRRAFEGPKVRTVLLADGDRFVGSIERNELPESAPDADPARHHLAADPVTVTPDMPISEAIDLLEGRPEPRLIVLDPDGITLRGLLCINGNATGFCLR